MVTVIFPIDPSTSFLIPIIDSLKDCGISLNTLEVEPCVESYSSTIEQLKAIQENGFIIFLGHGSEDGLFGGESSTFGKQFLVSLKEMILFKQCDLFVLACDSNQLLKKSFKSAQLKKSLGFGPLPTDIVETATNKLKDLRVTYETIESFKFKIVSIVSDALVTNFSRSNYDIEDIKDHLIKCINFEINCAILKDKDRKLADLLYYMKDNIEVY